VLQAAFFYLNVAREKLPKRLLYKKLACKMLMKLTPNVKGIFEQFFPYVGTRSSINNNLKNADHAKYFK